MLLARRELVSIAAEGEVPLRCVDEPSLEVLLMDFGIVLLLSPSSLAYKKLILSLLLICGPCCHFASTAEQFKCLTRANLYGSSMRFSLMSLRSSFSFPPISLRNQKVE